MLCWILIVGGLLIMMGQHDRSEALFYYFRLVTCHSSCRRSRFSQLGTQIFGKRFSNSNCRINCASCRSVFCLRTRLVRISAH